LGEKMNKYQLLQRKYIYVSICLIIIVSMEPVA
jgi:hypothetical protein